jgi:hypothetical protein
MDQPLADLVQVEAAGGPRVGDNEFHVYDQAGEPLVVVPRTSSKEVTRRKDYGDRDRVG